MGQYLWGKFFVALAIVTVLGVIAINYLGKTYLTINLKKFRCLGNHFYSEFSANIRHTTGSYAHSRHTTGSPKPEDDPNQEFYTNPSNRTQRGVPFHVDKRIWRRLEMPPRNFVTLNSENVRRFVVLTACSENHFIESMDAIGSVQKRLPGYKIIYYDIGLAPAQITKLKKICNVVYRKFDFDAYPGHLRYLTSYGWKPVIIMEALGEFGGVLWLDASARLMRDPRPAILDLALRSDGIAVLANTSGIWERTMPHMYYYLPTNVHKQITNKAAAANRLFFFNTKSAYWGVLHWWVLCALEQFCISPAIDKLRCKKVKGVGTYMNCHRYDQSALSILLGNMFDFKTTKYTLAGKYRISVAMRYRTSYYKVKYSGTPLCDHLTNQTIFGSKMNT